MMGEGTSAGAISTVPSNLTQTNPPLPVGSPMALTPALAEALGLPNCNIPPDMKVELVTVYVVCFPVVQQGKTRVLHDVATSDTVPPLADAVATYSNQLLLWRSADDDGSGWKDCSERKGALLK